MKLKEPGLMTSAWWLKQCSNGGENFRIYRDSVEGYHTGRKVSFPIIANADGSLSVAANGNLIVTSNGHNAPNWRDDMSRDFGVVCEQAKGLAKMLTCPTTGKPIPVSRIKNNPVLWCDDEHGRAVVAWGVKYESPEGAPIAAEKDAHRYYSGAIKYSFANMKANKVLRERVAKLQNEAKLRLSLTGTTIPMDRYAYQKPSADVLEAVFKHPQIVDIESLMFVVCPGMPVDAYNEGPLTNYCLYLSGISLDRDSSYWTGVFDATTADKYESTYLIYGGPK